MKRGRQTQGFTIVETMIFLAVSGALLLSAIAFITSTQSNTQFNQAANDALQQINGVINNVADGYYAGNDNVTCSVSGNAITSVGIGPANARGTNDKCVFLGRVIEFGTGAADNRFTVHDVAGLRTISSGGAEIEVTDMATASSTLVTGTEQIVTYRNGLRFGKLTQGAVDGFDAVGFFGTLGKVVSSGLNAGQLQTASQQNDFVGFRYNQISTGALRGDYVTNKDASRDGMTLCLTDGERQAEIIIRGQRRSANTSMVIGIGTCS